MIRSITAENREGDVVLTINTGTEIRESEELVYEFILTESQAEKLVQPIAFAAHNARDYLEALRIIKNSSGKIGGKP